MMTVTELRAEIVYRTDERLGILGFTDPENTPNADYNQALREAKAWAQENHPETYKLLYPTKP